MRSRSVLELCLPVCAQPETGKIFPGTLPLDTDGNEVHAHGGGIYMEDSIYYWVGTSKKLGSAALSEAITLYKSPDLATWDFVGNILLNTSIKGVPPPTSAGYRIERPKIIKCRGTAAGDKPYKMWWHLDTASFGIQMVGTAQAASVEGPWEFVAGFQPDGQRSYDMGLYQDPTDGSSWLVRSVDNQYAGISRLTEDCLNTTGIVSKGPRIEGQGIFRYGGFLYLLGSHLTGWAANGQILSVTDSKTLDGAEWTELGNPSGDPTTFESQDTFVLPYRHPNGDELPIYMGDRWNADGPGGVSNASYVWLPMVATPGGPFGSSVLNFTWHDSWVIGDF